MTEFKVGDKVRIKGETDEHPVSTVTEAGLQNEFGAAYRVNIHGRSDGLFKANELVPVEPKHKRGDRVRVTVEGRFYADDEFYLGLDGVAILKDASSVDILNVEKVEPPVEVFKPGDRLRPLNAPTLYEITVADGGYLQHFTGSSGRVEWYPEPNARFSSRYFEKVNLAEVPF